MQIESTTNGTMAEVVLKLVFAFSLLSLSIDWLIDWLIDAKGWSTLNLVRFTLARKNLFKHALVHLPFCLY